MKEEAMANEARNDMANIWKTQPATPAAISLEQLRRKSRKLEKRVQWRNVREYLASVIVIAAFGYYISVFQSTLVRIGCGLVIAGTLFMVYMLHQRGASRTVPAELAFHTCVDFHRRELERQRDLLRSVWTWYLLPFVPGMAVFLAGLFRQTMGQPNAPADTGAIVAVFALTVAVCALVFVAVGKLNQWGARNLQREIDALNALEKES
jgi:hypothetical protein